MSALLPATIPNDISSYHLCGTLPSQALSQVPALIYFCFPKPTPVAVFSGHCPQVTRACFGHHQGQEVPGNVYVPWGVKMEGKELTND